MLLLLLVSVIGAVMLHRKYLNRYYKEYYGECAEEKYRNRKYPWKDTGIFAGIVFVPAILTYLFVRRYSLLGMIPIAILIAVLTIWICCQVRTLKMKALLSLSLVPAALAFISKATLADKTQSVSISSMIVSAVIPVAVCAAAAFVRWLYVSGYFIQLEKAELEAKLKNGDLTEIQRCQYNSKFTRISNKEHGITLKNRILHSIMNGFSDDAEYDSEEEVNSEEEVDGYGSSVDFETEESDSEEMENIYSDSAKDPTANNNKMFYLVVFGLLAIVMIVCGSILLISL